MNRKGFGVDWTIKFLVITLIITSITFLLMIVVAITKANNEKTEIIVDCYDKEGNLIKGINCTKEVFYCNKLENLFSDNCILKGEENGNL